MRFGEEIQALLWKVELKWTQLGKDPQKLGHFLGALFVPNNLRYG